MNGIYLDTVKRNDAIIEFKNTYPLIDDFDKMDGFLLYYSNDHFFGSQWKDHPIIIRSFVPVESAENKNENTEKTLPPEPSPETETLSETEASPTSSLSEYIEALQLEKDAKNSHIQIHQRTSTGRSIPPCPCLLLIALILALRSD